MLKPSNKKKINARKTSKAKIARLDWIRKPRVMIFVALFAVAGAYAIYQANAYPSLPQYSDDIVAGYIDLKPITVSRDDNGNTSFEMYPTSIILQADGTLVCDAGGENGSVTTGSLSRQDVRKLHKSIVSTNVTSLADEIGSSDEKAVVSLEGIVVAEGSEAKSTAVYPGSDKPDKFAKAKNILQRLCTKTNRKADRNRIKPPREPKIKKTDKRKTAFTNILDLVTPKAVACCTMGTRDSEFEWLHAAEINNYRASKGRARLTGNSCLSERAAIWSDNMARQGHLVHSPNYGQDASWCGFNWRKTAENVGTGPRNNSALMKAFIASPGHNANLLDPSFKAYGVGAVLTPKGTIYVTQRFVAY